ncbi:hypothetical protein DFH11DRAFT_302629 [Phellopilus nigrolimitatus]|nr:hypothetical protein DFH11DRAFT_302629 [Phellopilus nigrolimitatus]
MFSADASQPHIMKGDLLDLDFTMDMDHRKRRRNRTTQSCLNCHTSKRKCDRKRPCQRCIQLGLTGLCVYEVDDPALRDDPDLDETTRLRNRIAELESLVRELRGKPHPRWADPNYYDGDASDKWHTRSQKRSNLSTGTVKPRRLHSPPPEHAGSAVNGVSVKTEPVNDMQHAACYYRLSPSPPPHSAPNAPYSMNIGQLPTDHFAQGPFDVNGGAGGCSPVAYSPSSSASSGLNGQSPHDLYRYDDSCPCTSDPAANHSFIALARQLEGMSNYLQHLPEHTQNRCHIYRRIQELKSILHGDSSPKSSSTSPPMPFGGYDPHGSDSLRSPVDSDLMTPLSLQSSVPLSSPATPHSLHVLQWATDGGNAHHNGHVNPYFANQGVYSKAVNAYDVVA